MQILFKKHSQEIIDLKATVFSGMHAQHVSII